MCRLNRFPPTTDIDPILGIVQRLPTQGARDLGKLPLVGATISILVRDLLGTLRRIHALLAAEGLFISKTPYIPRYRKALSVSSGNDTVIGGSALVWAREEEVAVGKTIHGL
jgi:hypothetical protein